MNGSHMMQNSHIEGLDALMVRFAIILEEVRRRPYELLDASKTIFERDFLEFNVHISELESSIQVKIFKISRFVAMFHLLICNALCSRVQLFFDMSWLSDNAALCGSLFQQC